MSHQNWWFLAILFWPPWANQICYRKSTNIWKTLITSSFSTWLWIFCSLFGLPVAIKIILSKITILMWHELFAKTSFVPISWAVRNHCSSEKSEDQEGNFAVLKMSHMKETRTVIIYVIWWKFNVEINILLFTVPIKHPVVLSNHL